jgi:hypothetical protein
MNLTQQAVNYKQLKKGANEGMSADGSPLTLCFDLVVDLDGI